MINLWCNHVLFPGRWVPGNNFNRIIPHPFNTITDLWSQISTITSENSIQRLGIMVHGDEGELLTGVNGEDRITPQRIYHDDQLRTTLTNIGTHLSLTGTILFYSCSAGASEQGSNLLKAFSLIWPGRSVIGSITKGYRYATLTAGNVQDTLLTVIEQIRHTDHFFIPGSPPTTYFYLPGNRLPQFFSVRATTKKAINGRIIHWPSGPQAFRQFEICYPANTRNILLGHPAQMIANDNYCFRRERGTIIPSERGMQFCPPGGATFPFDVAESDRQFYSNLLININHPRRYGEQRLRLSSRIFHNY